MFRALIWLLPGGPVLALALVLAVGAGPAGLPETLAGGYRWVVYVAAFLLAGLFHRSRVVVAVVALGVAELLTSARAGGFTGFFLTGGVLALVLGGLALARDRGILSPGGLLQAGAALMVGLVGAGALLVVPEEVAALLGATPLPPFLTRWSGLPQPVFLLLLLAGLVAVGAAVRRKGPVERGILWALPGVALALRFAPEPPLVSLFLMASGLIVAVSVLETSYLMAYRDDLTGLPARRALLREMEGLGGVWTAAMVDVDHFKRFNDRHGHDVGDQVLRMVAACLARVPGGGRAFRYGGEEFALLLPGMGREEALPRLEAVRRAVEGAEFRLRSWRRPRKKPGVGRGWQASGASGRRLSVTVSIGVADSRGMTDSPEGVLKRADQALYRAKKGGRNRVSR